MDIPLDALFNPEKYGLQECNHCNGYGSSFKDAGDGRCSVCGGSGLVKKNVTTTVEAEKTSK